MEHVNCDICASDNPKKLFAVKDRLYGINGSFNLVECQECGLVYLNPRPTASEMSRFYPEEDYYAYSEAESFFTRLREVIIRKYYGKGRPKRANIVWEALSHVLKNKVGGVPKFRKDGSVLDVGCGGGHTLGILKEIGWQVWGIEVSPKGAKIARTRGLNVFEGTLEAFEPENRKFDVVRLWHVLEHIHCPSETLSRIYSLLKSDGVLIIGVPNVNSLQYRLFKDKWYHLDPPRHLYHFTETTLRKLVKNAGFEVVRIRYFSDRGIVGSLQYLLNEIIGRIAHRRKSGGGLINNSVMIALEFPINVMIDSFKRGDVIEIHAVRGNVID